MEFLTKDMEMAWMENLTPLKAAIDIWKMKHGKPEVILSRQRSRLADLIRFCD
jgi:phenylacetate-CoA ligase